MHDMHSEKFVELSNQKANQWHAMDDTHKLMMRTAQYSTCIYQRHYLSQSPYSDDLCLDKLIVFKSPPDFANRFPVATISI